MQSVSYLKSSSENEYEVLSIESRVALFSAENLVVRTINMAYRPVAPVAIAK